jgi:hypothetical protein
LRRSHAVGLCKFDKLRVADEFRLSDRRVGHDGNAPLAQPGQISPIRCRDVRDCRAVGRSPQPGRRGPPMQEIQVEPVCPEAAQAALAGRRTAVIKRQARRVCDRLESKTRPR